MAALVNTAYAISERATELINNIINELINPLIVLLIGIGIVVFLWGVFEFVGEADDPQKLENGKRHIMWGVIGIAIMVSVFGIMNLICNTIDC